MREEKNYIRFTAACALYLCIASVLFWQQNCVSVMGQRGIHNIREFTRTLLYESPEFLRLIFLIPLCVLILIRSRYYFGEQQVIRRKSRKRIYGKLLGLCLYETAVFAVFTTAFLFAAGGLFGVFIISGTDIRELFYIFGNMTGVFLGMSVLVVSVRWLTGREVFGVILLCAVGMADFVTGYRGIHVILPFILLTCCLAAAEKKEFYHEKYQNDLV